MTGAPVPSEQEIALYDRFTHGEIGRRSFLQRMTALAGSVAAAGAVIAVIRADDSHAQTIDPSRVEAETVVWTSAGRRRQSGYLARPLGGPKHSGAVLVIHENRGLNEHIRDVSRRFAVAGYPALALDFLAPVGGTPADEDAAREAIGKLDPAQSTRDAMDAIAFLGAAEKTPVAVTGFCWGGGMTLRLAVHAGGQIAAAIPFYGSAPDPALAARVEAPVTMQLAGLDDRVNSTALPFAEALEAAGKPVTVNLYDGVNHAFHNDTSLARYAPEAANLAWQRTLAALAEAFAI